MTKISTAMVLAAGLGKRMRPLTDNLPKPLVPVAGTPLIDYTLDRLAQAGVTKAVVNVHYLADMLEAYLANREVPEIIISDERDGVLETGGGLLKAREQLGLGPFFCTNTDAILSDPPDPGDLSGSPDLSDAPEAAWSTLVAGWDETQMDALLLLCPLAAASGYQGKGDFVLNEAGQVRWPGNGDRASRLIFTGLQIIHPRLLEGEMLRRVSTKAFWDKAMAQGRLYGLAYAGRWMHVGDPAGLGEAEAYLEGGSADGGEG